MSASRAVLWWVTACIFFCTIMLTASRLESYAQLGLYGAYAANSGLFWQAEQTLRRVEYRLADEGEAMACVGVLGCGVSVYHQDACATQYHVSVCASSGRGKQCVNSIYNIPTKHVRCSVHHRPVRMRWAREFH